MGSVIGGGLESFLHRQAREQAMNVMAEAREMAETILRRAEERIAVEMQEQKAQGDEILAGKRQRALTQARHRARLAMVARQGEVAAQVWSTSRERMQALSDVERRASLSALLTDAIAQLGSGELLISCAAQDRDVVAGLIESEGQSRVGVDLRLAQEPEDILGGVIVTSATGNRVVDNSWEGRLRLVERTRRDEVLNRLS